MDTAKKLFQLLLLVFILFTYLHFDTNAQSVKKLNKYVEKAEKKFEKGKFEKALKFANKLEARALRNLVLKISL